MGEGSARSAASLSSSRRRKAAVTPTDKAHTPSRPGQPLQSLLAFDTAAAQAATDKESAARAQWGQPAVWSAVHKLIKRIECPTTLGYYKDALASTDEKRRRLHSDYEKLADKVIVAKRLIGIERTYSNVRPVAGTPWLFHAENLRDPSLQYEIRVDPAMGPEEWPAHFRCVHFSRAALDEAGRLLRQEATSLLLPLDVGLYPAYNFYAAPRLDCSLEALRAHLFPLDLPGELARRFSADLLAALRELHRNGFVHGHLSPHTLGVNLSPDAHLPAALYLTDLSTISTRGRHDDFDSKWQPLNASEVYKSFSQHYKTEVETLDDLEQWLFITFDLFNMKSLLWRTLVMVDGKLQVFRRPGSHGEIAVAKKMFKRGELDALLKPLNLPAELYNLRKLVYRAISDPDKCKFNYQKSIAFVRDIPQSADSNAVTDAMKKAQAKLESRLQERTKILTTMKSLNADEFPLMDPADYDDSKHPAPKKVAPPPLPDLASGLKKLKLKASLLERKDQAKNPANPVENQAEAGKAKNIGNVRPGKRKERQARNRSKGSEELKPEEDNEKEPEKAKDKKKDKGKDKDKEKDKDQGKVKDKDRPKESDKSNKGRQREKERDKEKEKDGSPNDCEDFEGSPNPNANNAGQDHATPMAMGKPGRRNVPTPDQRRLRRKRDKDNDAAKPPTRSNVLPKKATPKAEENRADEEAE